ncbi:polyamine oxidase 4-like [Capsicum annuum]|uniref:polyamine oxidase 4-like n=1 Tax=Capsicum annuum TaxID=4072 RepID=UPI001FB0A858|nr:polyamine oxidase 4-like [Capsicum annuum]
MEMLLERGLVLGQCHLIGQARGRLHGVCDENLLAPLIRWLELTMFRTSGDNSCCMTITYKSSYFILFVTWMVIKFVKIQLFKLEMYSRKSSSETEKVRNEHSHDLSVL